MRLRWLATIVVACATVLVACGEEESPATTAAVGAPEQLAVVATTTHIADFARQVGGERVSVESLLPANADAHDFEPTPRDVERVADADLILEHGMGLDAWAADLVRQSGAQAAVRTVTTGVTAREVEDDHDAEDHQDDSGHGHGAEDPHVWLDVANAKVMVANVRDALVEVDPEGRPTYEANATAYLGQLDELDSWIREQIATIPIEQRKLVTTHDAFGYYVEAYGLEFVGAVIPSLDSQAQPSAQDTARLIDLIRAEQVRAIFVETSLSPALAQQIANETGATVVDNLYGDSLGDEGTGADTYIGMMRANTTAIVEALRG
jgi:zinc/manganese transport system substrate-binding protein